MSTVIEMIDSRQLLYTINQGQASVSVSRSDRQSSTTLNNQLDQASASIPHGDKDSRQLLYTINQVKHQYQCHVVTDSRQR